MKGVNYVTNDKGEKIAIMISLKNHDQAIDEYLEELMDLIDIEMRKDEESISWEDAKKQLRNKA